MGALMPPDQVKSRFEEETAQAAANLFRALSHQHALHPSFVSLMAFKIQQLAWQQEPPDTYDYAYWKNRGWLDPACTFYLEHRASRAKIALARFAGAVIARFVV